MLMFKRYYRNPAQVLREQMPYKTILSTYYREYFDSDSLKLGFLAARYSIWHRDINRHNSNVDFSSPLIRSLYEHAFRDSLLLMSFGIIHDDLVELLIKVIPFIRKEFPKYRLWPETLIPAQVLPLPEYLRSLLLHGEQSWMKYSEEFAAWYFNNRKWLVWSENYGRFMLNDGYIPAAVDKYSYLWLNEISKCILLCPDRDQHNLCEVIYVNGNKIRLIDIDEYVVKSEVTHYIGWSGARIIPEKRLEYQILQPDPPLEVILENLKYLWEDGSTYRLIFLENAPGYSNYIIYDVKDDTWTVADYWQKEVYQKMLEMRVPVLEKLPDTNF